MILFWIVLIVAAVIAVWGASSRNRGKEAGEAPEQILKRRYARGEIDRETYDRMRHDLS